MCAGCGCGDLENDHGDSDNLKMSDINAATVAAGKFLKKPMTAEDYMHNLHDSIKGEEDLNDLPKFTQAELNKDWAEWDAERAAEEAGLGRGVGRELRPRARGRARTSIRFKGPLKTARYIGHHWNNSHGGHGGAIGRMASSLAHAISSIKGPKGPKGKAGKSVKQKAKQLAALHDHIHAISPRGSFGHDHLVRGPATAQNSNPGVGKLLKGLAKRLGKEETGRFTGTKQDTHSHRQQNGDIVTHTHDGDKGHTHPGRSYGPSFHHG